MCIFVSKSTAVVTSKTISSQYLIFMCVIKLLNSPNNLPIFCLCILKHLLTYPLHNCFTFQKHIYYISIHLFSFCMKLCYFIFMNRLSSFLGIADFVWSYRNVHFLVRNIQIICVYQAIMCKEKSHLISVKRIEMEVIYMLEHFIYPFVSD